MDKQKAYLKYKDDFNKTSIFSIILWAITIAGVLALIFLPVFKIEVKYEGITLATKEFSMLDELLYNIDAMNSSSSNLSMVGIEMMIFPALTVVMGAILFVIGVKNLFEEINNRNEDAYMVKYSQIRKSGGEKEKKKFFRQQTLYAFFVYIAFAVFFAKIFGGIFANGGISLADASYLSEMNGISIWGILGILLFVGYVVVHVLKTKKEKEITVKITKEEFENESVTEENKTEKL